MSILVDTNLLPRGVQPTSPQFMAATECLRVLNRRNEQLCVLPQNVYEFWVVCTRPPSENGLGWDTAKAQAEQARVLSLFTLLPDGPSVFQEWQRLVVRHDVKGKNAHDARLVAGMIANGIGRILTFNDA